MFSGFGLKPPASGFQSYSYSSLKTSPSVTFKAFSCFRFFCLLVSSVSDFRPDTRRRWWTLLGSLVLSCCGEGGTLQTNNTGVCLQCLGHTEFAPAHGVYFSCLHCLGSRLLCQELSEASPGLYALPRSKPLRFRYLGTSQRHRLCWACVCAFPGPSSSGDQVLG